MPDIAREYSNESSNFKMWISKTIWVIIAVEDLYGVKVEKNENKDIVFDGNKPNVDGSDFQMLTA